MRTQARVLGVRVLGALLVAALIPLALLMAASGCSRWGAVELAALFVLGLSLASAWRRRRALAIGAAIALAAIALLRLARTSANDRVGLRELRVLDALVDEEDVSRAATTALPLTGFGKDPDVPKLAGAMKDGYARMRADAGDVGSPFVATYLGLESPDRFDTIAIGDDGSDTVLVFLHGFAGSFTLPCWQVAESVRDLGVRTVCPATGMRGDWWSADGERTLRATLDAERARGARHFLLAGLSNGGIGASLLAPRMRGSFEALVCISGADPTAPAAGVPTLVVQGTADSMVATASVESYASRAGARRATFSAGHFVLLVEHERVARAMHDFVRGVITPRPMARR